MKYYYYLVQTAHSIGFSNQNGLYKGEFFNWNELKLILKSEGTKNPMLMFFKEINEQEYLSFAESFKV